MAAANPVEKTRSFNPYENSIFQNASDEQPEISTIELAFESFTTWMGLNHSEVPFSSELLLKWLSIQGYRLITSYAEFCELSKSLDLPPIKEEFYPAFVRHSPLERIKDPALTERVKILSFSALDEKFSEWIRKHEKLPLTLTEQLLAWIANESYEYIADYASLIRLFNHLVKQEKYLDLTLPSEEDFLKNYQLGWDKDLIIRRKLSNAAKV